MITPDLILSDDALTFARTAVGKPVFLVLRVATDEANVPVRASTDQPDLFQLADDNRPLFNSSLTLTPGTAGTYIHIRYLPTHAGTHDATLILESALGTRTVSLSGRSSRLSPLGAPTNRALTRTVVPRRRANPIAGRLAIGLGGAALLTGLIYAGITYRCTLMPSLCREQTAVPTVPASAPTARPEPTAATPTTPATRPSTQTAEPLPDPSTATVAKPTPSVRRAEPTVVAGEPGRRPAEKARPTNRLTAPKTTPAPAVVTPARPRKADSETEESELERALNGHTD